MALVNTSRGIGAISQTLRERLTAALGTAVDLVTVGRPEPPSAVVTGSRLNLFLFEVHHDEFLRNESLDDGQPPPLWLVLRYVVTSFDQTGDSDTVEAHEILGEGMRALASLNFLQPTAGTTDPLRDNPNELKVTFEPASVDLVSKLMQGPDQRYRCSAAFQVRPVLIAPAAAALYSQLVGIDYSAGVVIGEKGIRIPVLPSFGPALEAVNPATFEVGGTLTLIGTDMNLEGVGVDMGGVALPVTSRRPDRLEAAVPPSLAGGLLLSAGRHPIAVTQKLPTGRTRSSAPVLGGLVPRLDTAVPSSVVHVGGVPTAPVTAVIDMTGILLGTAADSTFVGLANASTGRIVRIFDEFTRPTADQTQLRLTIAAAHAMPPAHYRVVLRVNSMQARLSPEVDLT